MNTAVFGIVQCRIWVWFCKAKGGLRRDKPCHNLLRRTGNRSFFYIVVLWTLYCCNRIHKSYNSAVI